ncbi:MAG: DNA-directed RNA polymerase subunit omega [Clostridia bacterium]|nr:DNA-directed RNA polymerase subunit omega [Clostridia bacterium]
MVEPNVLELLKYADTRYTLVVEASKRGRQLVAGAQPLVDTKDMKPLGIAVEEIDRGLVTYDNPAQQE